MIHAEEVYNIYRLVQKEIIQRYLDQKTYSKLWMWELEQQGYKTFIPPNYDDFFSSDYVAPWQQAILKNSSAICLDAMHNTAIISGNTLL